MVVDSSKLESFKILVKRRARMVWYLSTVLFLFLAGNIYLMSVGAHIGAKPIFSDGIVTIALAYSIFLVFLGAAAAAFYVWWANKYLDSLIADVKRDLSLVEGGHNEVS